MLFKPLIALNALAGAVAASPASQLHKGQADLEMFIQNEKPIAHQVSNTSSSADHFHAATTTAIAPYGGRRVIQSTFPPDYPTDITLTFEESDVEVYDNNVKMGAESAEVYDGTA
ncbi:hypothetical protein PENFLA_c097G04508 [Penicillium flavigenum]|uniref:Uncharacterized protein n=1 Tax=Penicillium flavigenum TaxID=254877 RepID=A0A1V6S8G1_9EURO|nr:hypothetical protein PENFLA_c097G04508 [Penicillium flavigenum]